MPHFASTFLHPAARKYSRNESSNTRKPVAIHSNNLALLIAYYNSMCRNVGSVYMIVASFDSYSRSLLRNRYWLDEIFPPKKKFLFLYLLYGQDNENVETISKFFS
jgi:hypothetical protein